MMYLFTNNITQMSLTLLTLSDEMKFVRSLWELKIYINRQGYFVLGASVKFLKVKMHVSDRETYILYRLDCVEDDTKTY